MLSHYILSDLRYIALTFLFPSMLFYTINRNPVLTEVYEITRRRIYNCSYISTSKRVRLRICIIKTFNLIRSLR